MCRSLPSIPFQTTALRTAEAVNDRERPGVLGTRRAAPPELSHTPSKSARSLPRLSPGNATSWDDQLVSRAPKGRCPPCSSFFYGWSSQDEPRLDQPISNGRYPRGSTEVLHWHPLRLTNTSIFGYCGSSSENGREKMEKNKGKFIYPPLIQHGNGNFPDVHRWFPIKPYKASIYRAFPRQPRLNTRGIQKVNSM